MRAEQDDRIKWDVFQEKTTHLNDYRWPKADPRKIKKWQLERTEPPDKQRKEYLPHDHETFIPWRREIHVPFNLLWEPKPITGEDPKRNIVKNEKYVDKDKDEAIKTRPRIYMSPAVSFDDIPDPEMRKMLVKFMYTTDWKKATEEAALPINRLKSPQKVGGSTGDPLEYKVEIGVPLPLGWAQKCHDWDNKQTRASVNPTAQFWKYKEPRVKCGACEDPLKDLVPQKTKDEIKRLILEEKLRQPHDLLKPGYAGYQPRMAKGVSLEKYDLPITHPTLSLQQVIAKRWESK